MILLKNVGNIEFGMLRDQVRNLLGECREFKKSKFSSYTTDDFGYCHVYYTEDNRCEAVEIFNEVIVRIDNQVIFPLNFLSTCQILKELDGEVQIEKEYCTSIKQSIGVYAPEGKAESILFGSKGYYQN